MNTLKHFEGPTFEADVLKSELPVLVDFWATWCPPCRAMEPVVERLASEFAGRLTVGKLDTDENQEIAIRYGVMGIPTLGLFRDGKMVDRMVGFSGDARIKAWVESNVKTATV